MKKYEYISYGFLLALAIFSGAPAYAVGRVNIQGVLEQIAPDKIIVKPENASSTAVNLNDNTIYYRKFGGRASFSEFSVGDEVKVQASKGLHNALYARKVEDVSIFKTNAAKLGTVLQITGSSEFKLKMLNNAGTEYTVKVMPNTSIREKGKKKEFKDLIVGMKVNTTGILNERTQTVNADSITLNPTNGREDDDIEDRKIRKNVSLIGVLEQFTPDKITVKIVNAGSSTVVNVDERTKITRRFGAKISVSELEVNDVLRIRGKRNAENGEIYAKEIRDISSFKMKIGQNGIVQGVSGNEIIMKPLSGKDKEDYVIKISDKTKIRSAGKKIPVSDIKIGQKINAIGMVNTNTNKMSADRITVLYSGVSTVDLMGNIESIDTPNKQFVFVYSGGKATVKVTSLTKIVFKGQVKTFADLKIGGDVRVKGTRDVKDNSLITAEEVRMFE